MDPKIFAAAVFTSLVSGASTGLCGFGSAIVLHAAMSQFENFGLEGAGDLKMILALTIVLAIVGCTQILVQAGRDARSDYVLWSIPTVTIGTVIGTYLLVDVDPYPLKVSLGLMFFALATWQTIKILQDKRKKLTAVRFDLARRNSMSHAPNSDPSASTDIEPLSPSVSTRDNFTPSLAVEVSTSSMSNSNNAASPYHLLSVSPTLPTHAVSASDDSTETNNTAPARTSCTARMCANCPTIHVSKECIVTQVKQKQIWGLWFAAFCSGVLNGAFGAGGPPFMIFFALMALSKSEVRSTQGFLGLVTGVPRVIMAFAAHIFVAEHVPLYILCGLASLIGYYFGDKVHHKVDTATVMLVLMVLVFSAAFTLSGAGDESKQGSAFLVTFLIVIIPLVLYFLYVVIARCFAERKAKALGIAVSSKDPASPSHARTHANERHGQSALMPPSAHDSSTLAAIELR